MCEHLYKFSSQKIELRDMTAEFKKTIVYIIYDMI